MNRILLLLTVLLTACATQTPYKPAAERGAEGYTETRLTNDRYRISFRGNSLTPADTVRDYALLRAAELTLQEGQDWFQLIDSDTDKNVRSSTSVDSGFISPPQTSVYQRCGLLACDTTVVTTPGYASGPDLATTTTTTSYTTTLDILIGKKPMPAKAESYDARQLAGNLRRLLQPQR